MPGTHIVVKRKRIIRKHLQDSDGATIGDVNAVIAVNVGEPGGSQTHVASHARVVQRARAGQASETVAPQPPVEADDPKEDA